MIQERSVFVSSTRDIAGFEKVTLQNELLTVTVCPEACRILSIENRVTNTGYLRRLESQLPDNARAGGIGDSFYAEHWRGGMWEEVRRNHRLGGYSHQTGSDGDLAWMKMRKESLHDLWGDPGS